MVMSGDSGLVLSQDTKAVICPMTPKVDDLALSSSSTVLVVLRWRTSSDVPATFSMTSLLGSLHLLPLGRKSALQRNQGMTSGRVPRNPARQSSGHVVVRFVSKP